MSSSRHSPSHRYHRQQQFRPSSRSPSHSSHSHPVFESPLALSPNPAAAASSLASARGTPSLVDPNSTAGTLTGGGDFLDPTQIPRGSVRSARSFSSPSSSIGLTAGSTASQFHSSAVYPGAGLGSGLASSHGRQRLSTGDPRSSPSYQLSSGPVTVGSNTYSTENMTHDTHSYWQGRPSHPHLQPSSMGFDQPFSSPQSLSPDNLSLGYNAQPGSSRSFYQSGDLSTQYLSVPGAGLPQGSHHPRSASMSYAFPGNPVTPNVPTMGDQSFMSSPSYFLNQSDYYFPDTSSLSPHPSPIPPISTPQPQTAAPPPLYPSSADSTPASTSASRLAEQERERQVRVLSFRPKPQCWEHGCNGREFSTFSNLLRHQREKSGIVAKAECPVCGAAFTRTTARNIHVAQGKCRGAKDGFDG